MALDLTGLHNHNEFFFEHYLTALLEGDLGDRLKTWDALGEENPARKVRALLRPWNSDFLHKYDTLKGKDRTDLAAAFLGKLAAALGFTSSVANAASGPAAASETVSLANAEGLRLFASAPRPDGSPGVWVLLAREPIAAIPEGDTVEDAEIGRDTPLLWPAKSLAWENEIPKAWQGAASTLDKLLGDEIFAREPAPRWVLILSPRQFVLCDRNKWAERRFLRFDLETLSSRKDDGALHAVAALLHRQSLQPDEGLSLLDELDDQSHKHAFGVSEDLKYSLRECIELLGNEAIYSIQSQKKGVYDRDLAGPLTRESLRFMYRLLFLFYLEARPELGYFPKRQKMRSRDPYWSGYSLESLRDLELVRLTTEESRNGFFMHHSLRRLMDMVYKGFQEAPQETMELDPEAGSLVNGFILKPLNAHLFDPDYDPETGNEVTLKLLRTVRYRNCVLQRVIRLMSLGKSGTGKRRRSGRISYAQLGINQLGAVYEGLLSFRGFFAEEDLFEVRRLVKDKKPDPSEDEGEDDGDAEMSSDSGEADEKPAYAGANQATDPLETAYFVTKAQLAECRPEEKVFETTGAIPKIKTYPKGTFIYRMAGRDREKSASYYTPAELTQTLVKYALLELLKDKTADQILDLTVCEPAMGSAAFLNEAVDQLAEAYLHRKKEETGKHLPVEHHAHEKQKVKMFLADNRVFGLDLNPVAVELAEVSLWLGTLHPDALVPWFRLQLNCGNSLVGARRSTVSFHGLDPREPGEPKRQGWTEGPSRRTAWHWLLPDNGMADFGDKVIKTIAPKGLADAKVWRKGFCGPINAAEQELLEAHTREAEKLWQAHAKQLATLRGRTSDVIDIWGQPPRDKKISSTRDKDKILDGELYSRHMNAASPYRRLKLAMDYWCALWFWPIEQSHLLPDRQQWMLELGLLLHGEVHEDVVSEPFLFPETAMDDFRGFLLEHGVVDVDALSEKFPRFKLVTELAERHRFFHWELEYADIFLQRGGFDLILGNPPWLKIEWNEGGVIGDVNPLFVLRNHSANESALLREKEMDKLPTLRQDFLIEYGSITGLQNFLKAHQNYPELRGQATNLFKCFLPISWRMASSLSVQGFLHPEGVYDDPRAGDLRENIYSRLRHHYQFINVKKLFGEVLHWVAYSLNVYSSQKEPGFFTASQLFLPTTIDQSFSHNGNEVPVGIKTELGKWNINGHKDRIIFCGINELALFAKLYDEPGTPAIQARLPIIFVNSLVTVLKKLASYNRRLGETGCDFSSLEMWNETTAQKKGTILKRTTFPVGLQDWILSGPHFFVGNPIYKTPNRVCSKHHDYTSIDLESVSIDYLPRTNFLPNVLPDEYLRRTPQVPWGEEQKVTDKYRLVCRRQLSKSGERTLIPALLPPSAGHIHQVISTVFSDTFALLAFTAAASTIVLDFYIKTTGKGDLYESALRNLPSPMPNPSTLSRILVLNCLTMHYADLWKDSWNDAYTQIHWSKTDPRLGSDFWKNLTRSWKDKCALRSDYSRRQALVELDVLCAKSLDLSLTELITIYRIQFPVLRQNESDTWYDVSGRIIFTCNRGLVGVGLPRTAKKGDKTWSIDAPGHKQTNIALGWEDVRDLKEGVITRTILDDTLPGGPKPRTIAYTAPFDRCDREADYRTAWEILENTPT